MVVGTRFWTREVFRFCELAELRSGSTRRYTCWWFPLMVVETQGDPRMVMEAFFSEAHIFFLLVFLQVSAISELFFLIFNVFYASVSIRTETVMMRYARVRTEAEK